MAFSASFIDFEFSEGLHEKTKVSSFFRWSVISAARTLSLLKSVRRNLASQMLNPVTIVELIS